MKIALINENSQAPKNELIFQTLKKAVEPMGHTCYNYGRYSAEDVHQRTYVQAGLLTALLLNSGAADFVITGCGTGMGATWPATHSRGLCAAGSTTPATRICSPRSITATPWQCPSRSSSAGAPR